MPDTDVIEDLPSTPMAPVEKLTRDIRKAGGLIGRDEARMLVQTYYQLQEHRIALRGQERSLRADGKPIEVTAHFAGQMTALERQMVGVLDAFSTSTEVGRWSRGILGIGPVLAAGLQAHIDITRAPTVGHIWRFAGLDPTVKWGKGERRPWNADLKVLCWKIGDQFVKLGERDDAFYATVYRARKVQEIERDSQGLFADQAAASLIERNIRDPKLKKILESGHLPPGRLDLRARRYAVKLFLAHWHEQAYREHFNTEPPKPYVIEHLGHVDYIAPPSS